MHCDWTSTIRFRRGELTIHRKYEKYLQKLYNSYTIENWSKSAFTNSSTLVMLTTSEGRQFQLVMVHRKNAYLKQ